MSDCPPPLQLRIAFYVSVVIVLVIFPVGKGYKNRNFFIKRKSCISEITFRCSVG